MPAINVGGLEVSIFRIAGYFREKEWQVTIISTEERGEWFDKIAENGFQGIHITGLGRFNFRNHAKTVGETISSGCYDVLFTVFDRFSQSSLSYLTESTFVVPLLRNDHPEVYEIGLASSRFWNVAVGNSPKVCKTARSMLPSKPIFLIPNGTHIDNEIDLPRRNWKNKERLNLLFVGRIVDESKRVLLLPAIMQTLKASGISATINIVGEGPDQYTLLQKISELGVMESCQLIGKLEGAELKRQYAAAHALIFCSKYEGLPNIVLEAMSLGCVPVATKLEGITDFLISDKEDGFLVPTNDAAAFASAVSQLATSDVGERMSERARTKVAQHFSTEHESDKFMSLVQQHREGMFSRDALRQCAVDSSLFPLRYVYRRSVRPYLVKVYKMLKGAILYLSRQVGLR